MSITRVVLVPSSEAEARDKVLANNPDQIGIWECWCLRRGENRSTRRKTSWSKDENQQQTQPTYNAKSENRIRATFCGRRVLSSLRHPCSPVKISPLKMTATVCTVLCLQRALCCVTYRLSRLP